MNQITNEMIQNWGNMLKSDKPNEREVGKFFLRIIYRKELKEIE